MRSNGQLNWFLLLARRGAGLGEACSDREHRYEVRPHDPDHGYPCHQACRCSDIDRQEVGFGFIDLIILLVFVEYYTPSNPY